MSPRERKDAIQSYRPVLSIEARDALTTLAESLHFVVTRPGLYIGTPSVSDLLDALAACYVADPTGTQQTLEALLMAHDLLPDKPGAADGDADAG